MLHPFAELIFIGSNFERHRRQLPAALSWPARSGGATSEADFPPVAEPLAAGLAAAGPQSTNEEPETPWPTQGDGLDKPSN